MAIVDGFRMELEHESTLTRKMLERYPEEKADWRPHAKSFTMQQLASHLADMHGYIPDILNSDGFNFDPETYKPWLCQNRTDLVGHFEELVGKALESLHNVDDAAMMQPWSLKSGEHVIFTLPRLVTLRSMFFNHAIHHRGQLTVYYRLCEVPVPSIYGPSADEAS